MVSSSGTSAIMSQYRLSENLQLLDRAVCCTGDLHGPRRPPSPLVPRRGPCPAPTLPVSGAHVHTQTNGKFRTFTLRQAVAPPDSAARVCSHRGVEAHENPPVKEAKSGVSFPQAGTARGESTATR